IDVGCGRGVDALLRNIEAAGVSPDRLRHLLLTHAHPDHCGATAAVKERLPHIQVTASPQVARWVRSADEQAMSVETGKRAEFYPADFAFLAARVDREVTDGQRLSVGEVRVQVVATPGHSDGHLSFLARSRGRTALFGGDLVFFGGRISLLNNWDCRLREYADSMAKLGDARIDALLPGHHSLSLRDGQRHVDTANRRFEHGFVPPSLV
ncbi:MAG: MBL fold metallo-hydrolase, partial [Actinomycetota bacterium]|nr:MBL fold metallo-hydrolase [Actinomycetota bacterium]